MGWSRESSPEQIKAKAKDRSARDTHTRSVPQTNHIDRIGHTDHTEHIDRNYRVARQVLYAPSLVVVGVKGLGADTPMKITESVYGCLPRVI